VAGRLLSRDRLVRELDRIDGRGYKAYKDIAGSYAFDNFQLHIDYVQGDPFAAPSRLRARVSQDIAGFDPKLYAARARRVALEDYLTRAFAWMARSRAQGNRGTGKSGMIAIDTPGQEVLERTSMVVNEDFVEARFVVGFPARGRRVLGKQAAEMLLEEVPSIVNHSLRLASLKRAEVYKHVELAEDQQFIRDELRGSGLIAFIADGAILPRESGVSDKPLTSGRVVPFRSPDSLRVTFNTPNSGKVTGMGIREGITLIVGGGYHGKSTVLRALERGVYNHIAGDGREFVITDPDAVKIRAEDGRRIVKVDISPFINNLPFGADTTCFSTEDASGSTSQAANIIDSLELGARVLLVDEDTSATNFMIRDVRMQELVAKDKEPITPFIDKVRQLYDDLGVSTVMVVGGSGDYFDVASTVIMMDEYTPRDVSDRAARIASRFEARRRQEGGQSFGSINRRVPVRRGIDPTRGRRSKIKPRGVSSIQFGNNTIDLAQVEQLVDPSQTAAIGDILYYLAEKYIDGRRDIRSLMDLAMRDIETEGLDVISPYRGQHPGEYALPRRFEIGAALNRLRTLNIGECR